MSYINISYEEFSNLINCSRVLSDKTNKCKTIIKLTSENSEINNSFLKCPVQYTLYQTASEILYFQLSLINDKVNTSLIFFDSLIKTFQNIENIISFKDLIPQSTLFGQINILLSGLTSLGQNLSQDQYNGIASALGGIFIMMGNEANSDYSLDFRQVDSNDYQVNNIYDMSKMVARIDSQNNNLPKSNELIVQSSKSSHLSSDNLNISIYLPPTKDNDDPFNWYENTLSASGKSSICSYLDKIVETEMKRNNINDRSKINITLAGFSQGGLQSAYFASKNSYKYKNVNILAYGTPISRFDFTQNSKVVSFEFDDDIVTKMDLKKENSPKVETVAIPYGANGVKEGTHYNEDIGQAHNALKYSDATKFYPPKSSKEIESYLPKNNPSTFIYKISRK